MSFEVEETAPQRGKVKSRAADIEEEQRNQTSNPLAANAVGLGWAGEDSDEDGDILSEDMLSEDGSPKQHRGGKNTKTFLTAHKDGNSKQLDLIPQNDPRMNSTDNTKLEEMGFKYKAGKEKHTFPASAVVAFKVLTGLTEFAALVSCVLAIKVYQCGDHKTVSLGVIAVAIFMMVQGLIGLYGALRVRADVEAETGIGGISLDAKATNFDDDGVETVGQNLLGVSFLCSSIGVLVWAVLAAQALSLADANQSGGCNNQYKLMIILGLVGFVASGLYFVQARKTKEILSSFIVTKTLAQGANMLLMLLGSCLAILTAVLAKSFFCIMPAEMPWLEKISNPAVVMLILLGLYSYNFAMVSLVGWTAAATEDRLMILKHRKLLMIWGGLGFVIVIGVMGIGVDDFVDLHCEELLQAISQEWFDDRLGCAKYNGPGLNWDGAAWQLTNAPSELPMCLPKELIAYAWEVNPVQRAGGGNVDHFGCLDKFCCTRMEEVAHGWKASIVIFFVFIFGGIAFLIWSGNKMAQGVRGVEAHATLYKFYKQVKIGIRVVLLLVTFVLSFVLFDNECATQPFAIAPIEDLPAAYTRALFFESCTNGVLDAHEADVDCGGMCEAICFAGQNCAEDTDCIQEPVNSTCRRKTDTSPYTFADVEDCDDGHCHANRARHGSCRMLPGMSCFDGVYNDGETCVDGGGAVCRSLSPPRLCQTTCMHDDDCEGLMKCANYMCALDCENSQMDNDETDVDCGGSDCNPCADRQTCSQTSDCISGLCFRGDGGWGLAVRDHCISHHNGVRDGNESCVDGGSATGRHCQVGEACIVHRDCETGLCDGVTNLCRALSPTEACYNHVTDGLETCVDGGGYACRLYDQLCVDSLGCKVNADCHGGQCFKPDSSSAGVCFNCQNNQKDGDESDVDCGGACDACHDGGTCITDGDCIRNSYCFGPTGSRECVSSRNNVMDGDETCVDGGGAAATRDNRLCAVGEHCVIDMDCLSRYCNQAGNCTSDSILRICNDGVQNGMETSTDCGGESCVVLGNVCYEGQTCAADTDCATALCVGGQCTSCTNGLQDGDETDVDCGGRCGSTCDDSQICLQSLDCTSGVCFVGSISTSCASCFNSAQDGDESDVDCGGSCAQACSIGDSCSSDADCAIQNCDFSTSTCELDASVIPTLSCSNGVRDIDETDADCGYSCVPFGMLCNVSQGCASGTDCVSGLCAHHACVSCTDGITSGLESDVDCGGPDCPACMDGHDCVSNDDCGSQLCVSTHDNIRLCTSCSNAVRDPAEADVDCGAVCPRACNDGQWCEEDLDCVSRDCVEGSCRAADALNFCVDSLLGQHETCIDGGGIHCSQLGLLCSDGTACAANRDCTSGMCHFSSNGTAGTCSSCFNAATDGSESDADCGGAECQPCIDGRFCNSGSDCQSTLCFNRTCISHSNGIRDGDETCVDAGGSSVRRCHGGDRCLADTDCRSGFCDDTLSNASCQHQSPNISCHNFEHDGFETDYDCGGPMCRLIQMACGVGQRCIEDADCTFPSVCGSQDICLQPDCTDLVLSADETDIDCGGSCDPCLPGRFCIHDGDCIAGSRCFDLSNSTDYTEPLHPNQTGACIIKAQITVAVAEGGWRDVTMRAGEPLAQPFAFAASRPAGPTGLPMNCEITVRFRGAPSFLFVPLGNVLPFSTFESAGCSTTASVTTSAASGEVVATGSVQCMNALVDLVRIDTTCASPWVHNVSSPFSDVATTYLTASIIQYGAFCEDGAESVAGAVEHRLGIELRGRPHVTLTGQAYDMACTGNHPISLCPSFQTILANVSGMNTECGVYFHELGPCEAFGCCDVNPALHGLACPVLLSYGVTCETVGMVGDNVVTISSLCPISCGTCPPAPPLDIPSTIATARAGFVLPVPFDQTADHSTDRTTTVTVAAAGYLDSSVIVHRSNTVVDVGYIPLLRAGVAARATVSGYCRPWEEYADPHVVSGLSGMTNMMVKLRPGYVVFPAAGSCESDCLSNNWAPGCCLVEFADSVGGQYSFAGIPAGGYTVECGSITADWVGPDHFNVAAPPGSSSDYQPPSSFVPPYLADGTLLLTLRWAAAVGSRISTTSFDVDLHVTFRSGGTFCHVFFGSPSCGGTQLVRQTSAAAADGEVALLGAVQPTSYAVYASLAVTSQAGQGTFPGVLSLQAEAFTGVAGKVGQALASADLALDERYVMLLCIRAAGGAVHSLAPRVAVSAIPPGSDVCRDA